MKKEAGLTGLQMRWEGKLMFKFLKREEKNLFPCKECLVRATCKQACDKIEMDDNKVADIAYKHGKCPDCGSEDFREGPSGGISTNIMCASCNHWFNTTPVVRQFERIHIRDGRFD